jgi:NosR/NirI family nitrous oxide reductase transcriptional regulator
MSARVLRTDLFRQLASWCRQTAAAVFPWLARPPTSRFNQTIGKLAALSLTLCVALQPAQAALLNRDDIDKLLDGQFIVGEVQPDMPVYPLFAKGSDAGGKPELKGYAFESLDFEPVRGYSGKPIDVLVAMDLTGAFIDLRLVDHKEPFFNNPTGTKRLGVFTAQYTDLTLQHVVRIHDYRSQTRRDDQSADLQGVNHGTVTTKAIDRSIFGSAAKVAVAKLDASISASAAARRRSTRESFQPLSWDDLLWRGMVQTTIITPADIRKAYSDIKQPGGGKLDGMADNSAALTLNVALLGIPSIGRNLLDGEGWRYLNTSRRKSQALLVTESGPLSTATDDALRVPDDAPFVLRQNGKPIKFSIIPYDKKLKHPGYPDKVKAYFLVVDKATPLDPEQPFNLSFKLGRRFGTNQVLNKIERREFPVAYDFYGWRANFYDVLDTDLHSIDWIRIWLNRWIEVLVLVAGLGALTYALIRQQRTSATSRRLQFFRVAYLIFTLGFIGWTAQGQLTIINITAAVESLRGGGDLSFLLSDPMSTILWLFTGVTLFVWGRATFCGWLCPFGALQELISLIANRIGVHQRRLRTAWDAKLKWVKYAVLAVILGSIFVAPSFSEMAVKVEPFETAISFHFVRDWPYILWAVICLAFGLFLYRGYCRYICPLGAALAAVNFLQRWSWIPRRDACGTPCQSCRHRCEYQAIAPSGQIQYSECFQCLDCVSIYQDDQRCLPLIQERKREHRVIPVQLKVEA